MKRAAHLALMLVVLAVVPALGAGEETGPTLTITSPEEGLTVASESVSVEATFAAAEGRAITQVELLVDEAVVATQEMDPPKASGSVSFTWAASGYAAGKHGLSVRATDDQGETMLAGIEVLLKRARAQVEPALRIASPKAGEAVSGTWEVKVEAGRPEVVKYVIYLVDDVFKAMTNMPPFSYLWDTTRYLNGLHRVQAKAYLSSGEESLSPVVEVRVDNPSGATVMRGPAPEPARSPERAAEEALPPPMRVESPVSEGSVVQAAEPEVAVPGTAPFVSPSGELITPPGPAARAPAAPTSRIEIEAVPDSAIEQTSAPVASGTTEVAPPLPAAEAAPEAAAAPEPASVEVARLPEAAVEPAAPAPPAAVPSPAAPPAPVIPEAAEAEPEPTAAPTEIALLPPRPEMEAPATKLTAEPPEQGNVYIVQPQDCLWAIAGAHSVPAAVIAEANGLADPNVIYPGQRLTIPSVPVYYDGTAIESEAPSVIVEGTALGPLRAVVERAGGRVSWEAAAREASAAAGEHTVTVKIGSSLAKVDGETKDMGMPARLVSDRTVVPLRFLGVALDLVVSYDAGVVQIASGR